MATLLWAHQPHDLFFQQLEVEAKIMERERPSSNANANADPMETNGNDAESTSSDVPPAEEEPMEDTAEEEKRDEPTNGDAIIVEEAVEVSLSSCDLEMESNDNDDGPTVDIIEVAAAAAPLHHGGIANLGNTCYMASALQLLGNTESFVQALQQQSPPQESPLRDALLHVFDRLRAGETVRPDRFKELLDEKTCLFEGFQQQDAHEFLTTLLDLLEEDYKEKKEAPPAEESLEIKPYYAEFDVSQIEQLLQGNAPPKEAEEEDSAPPPPTLPVCKLVGGRMNPADTNPTVEPPMEVQIPQSGAPSPATQNHLSANTDDSTETTEPEKESCRVAVDDNFRTKVRVRLTCDCCSFSRSHEETFLHWSLEGTTVEEGIHKHFGFEQREIKCEKCSGLTATQTRQITQLPQTLLLHLMRFVVEVSPDYSSITYRKNSSPVSFASSMDAAEALQDYLAPDCRTNGSSYSIRGVVNHIGSSASCGHYTADVCRDGQWRRCNDAFVTAITEPQAIQESESTAYLIAYERT